MLSGDYLVVAAGAQANFFGTPGAPEHALPLYSVNDAERLRARLLDVLDVTVERPDLIDQGSLNFVIVGGGPTGVETAGALAEVLTDVVPERTAITRRIGRRSTLSIMVMSCWHRSPRRPMRMPRSD